MAFRRRSRYRSRRRASYKGRRRRTVGRSRIGFRM